VAAALRRRARVGELLEGRRARRQGRRRQRRARRHRADARPGTDPGAGRAVTLVKVCGVNRADDLAVAVEAGADLIGFILVDWSPRAVGRAEAAELAEQVPAGVGRVGVFVDEDPATVAAIADELAL